MAELSIVVPVYHNEENLPDFISALENACAGSTMNLYLSMTVLKTVHCVCSRVMPPNIRKTAVIKLSRNFGSFTACVAGWRTLRTSRGHNIGRSPKNPRNSLLK